MSIDTAVNNLTKMLQNQLDNLQAMTLNHIKLVEDELDSDVDEYNHMIDLLESRDKQIFALTSQLSIAEEKANDAVMKMGESEAKFQQADAKHKIANIELTKVQRELKSVMAMNPERLAKKNKELSKEVRQNSEQVRELSRQMKELRKENSESKIHVGQLSATIADLGVENQKLIDKLNFHDGDVDNEVYYGSEGMEFYLYTFEWGLKIRPNIPTRWTMIDGLDWHFEVRSNIGVNVTCGLTTWCQAFFPACSEYDKTFPSDLYYVIEERAAERMAKTHPRLVERLEWARNEPISNITGITDKQLNLLSQLKNDKLLAIVTAKPILLANKVKGLSEKGALEIIILAENYAKEVFPDVD